MVLTLDDGFRGNLTNAFPSTVSRRRSSWSHDPWLTGIDFGRNRSGILFSTRAGRSFGFPFKRGENWHAYRVTPAMSQDSPERCELGHGKVERGSHGSPRGGSDGFFFFGVHTAAVGSLVRGAGFRSVFVPNRRMRRDSLGTDDPYSLARQGRPIAPSVNLEAEMNGPYFAVRRMLDRDALLWGIGAGFSLRKRSRPMASDSRSGRRI
jgi:hypothetical protein